MERRFKSLGCGERLKNGRHHVDLRRLIVDFITVAAPVMQTLHLVPDDRVVKQIEVSPDELTDQLRCISLVLFQLLCARRYLYR